MKKLTLQDVATEVAPLETTVEAADEWCWILPKFSKNVAEDGQRRVEGCHIAQNDFIYFLRGMGFRKWPMQMGYCYVHIADNVVEKVEVHQIRQAITRKLMELPETLPTGVKRKMVFETITRQLENLTSEAKLSSWLAFDDGEVQDFVEHTERRAFYFYKNGWVEVTKDGIEFRPYEKLPGLVWKDQILKRDYRPTDPASIADGQFYKFCRNVSGKGRNGDDQGHDDDRFSAFMTMTGYLCHVWFGQNQKAAIFMDARMSDQPDGRSGKSLHAKAIGSMLSPSVLPRRNEPTSTIFTIVDGKVYDPKNNRFALDSVVGPDTQMLIFDDIKRDFDLEMLFNGIVDGIMVESKGGRKFRVFAKIIITLNYTISLRGGSARDRAIEFEWADYYSADHKPRHEFGNNFFLEWSPEEWGLFDAFMLGCVRDYLRFGLIKAAPINVNARKLNDETNPEFVSFMDENLGLNHDSGADGHQKEFERRKLFETFVGWDEITKKPTNKDHAWLKPRIFGNWLKAYAFYKTEVAGYQERRSSGSDYIRFFFNEPVAAEHLENGKFPPVFFKEKATRVQGASPAGDSSAGGDKLPF